MKRARADALGVYGGSAAGLYNNYIYPHGRSRERIALI